LKPLAEDKEARSGLHDIRQRAPVPRECPAPSACPERSEGERGGKDARDHPRLDRGYISSGLKPLANDNEARSGLA